LSSLKGFSQNFADKDYYLVDSLEIDIVSESDKSLIDSCLTCFHQEKQDTGKVNCISTIVEGSWDDKVWPKYNLWLYHFTRKKLKEKPSSKVAKKLSIELASALNNIGYYNSSKGDNIKALVFYKKSLKIQEKLGDKEGAATSLNNIGSIYNKQSDIPNALEYYHKSLKIYTDINNKTGLGQCLNNIGNIYQEQKDPNLALEYFHRGLTIYEKLNNKRAMATLLNNIGFAYFKKKNIPKTLEYYNKSLAIREILNDKKGIAISYNNIASTYEQLKENEKAMDYYQKSVAIYSEIKYKLGLSTSLNNIGRILYSEGKSVKSKKNILKGLEIAKEVGSPSNIKVSAHLLSQIYEEEGNGMKALKMHKLYLLMRDSAINETNQKSLIQQHAKYEYQKEKAVDDAEHDNLIAIKQKEKEKQRIISYAIAFGLFLVIIFAAFVFNRLKIARKQKLVIEVQNKEIVDSINYAKRIQEAILPSSEFFKELFPASFIYYKPKDIVAGDFYWMEKQDGHILFAVADCTGHGVPGAMVSVVCNNALNASVREHKLIDPGEILNKTREIVVEQFNKSQTTSISNIRDGMDIALGVLNIKTNTIYFSGAYNPLWILRSGASDLEEIKATRQSIGKMDNPKLFTTSSTELNKGDQIYLFSDGFADQFGGDQGKKIMRKRFKELLISSKTDSMEDQKTDLDTHFEQWKGDIEQIDDVCVMGIRI
jgi:serine phosphatase RsbU (regulator of sigma subunit)/Tfp pilus assembly protein PilF